MNLKKLLEPLGWPVKYRHWKTEPSYPCLVYLFTNDSDFMADNQNYLDIRNYDIELYTTEKDFDAEAKLEQFLKENSFKFSKTESYIESEELYVVTYSTQLIGD